MDKKGDAIMKVKSISKVRREWLNGIPFWVSSSLDSYRYKSKRGFVAWKEAVVPPGSDFYSDTRCVCDGWNGSFHDAQYSGGGFLALGRTPAQAVARLKDLVNKNPEVDSSVVRFNLRNLVRNGD
jgi:hypothetical protein